MRSSGSFAGASGAGRRGSENSGEGKITRYYGVRKMSNIKEMTDIQDLELQIKNIACKKVLNDQSIRDFTEELRLLRVKIGQHESKIKILEALGENLEAKGLELTRNLLKLEEEAECEKGN
jgi:hypothetical protein